MMDAASEAMNLSKEISSVAPAKVVFGSVGILLTIIKVHFLLFYYDELRFIWSQDSMANKQGVGKWCLVLW